MGIGRPGATAALAGTTGMAAGTGEAATSAAAT
jgi:hypothetical protein